MVFMADMMFYDIITIITINNPKGKSWSKYVSLPARHPVMTHR